MSDDENVLWSFAVSAPCEIPYPLPPAQTHMCRDGGNPTIESSYSHSGIVSMCDNPTKNMAELAISDDCKFGKPN